MAHLTLDDIRKMSQTLYAFMKETVPCESQVFLDEDELEEVNGICEKLFMTNLPDAILVHYGADGDWTKALFVPKNNFDGEDYEDQYSPVDEALEWFFE